MFYNLLSDRLRLDYVLLCVTLVTYATAVQLSTGNEFFESNKGAEQPSLDKRSDARVGNWDFWATTSERFTFRLVIKAAISGLYQGSRATWQKWIVGGLDGLSHASNVLAVISDCGQTLEDDYTWRDVASCTLSALSEVVGIGLSVWTYKSEGTFVKRDGTSTSYQVIYRQKAHDAPLHRRVINDADDLPEWAHQLLSSVEVINSANNHTIILDENTETGLAVTSKGRHHVLTRIKDIGNSTVSKRYTKPLNRGEYSFSSGIHIYGTIAVMGNSDPVISQASWEDWQNTDDATHLWWLLWRFVKDTGSTSLGISPSEMLHGQDGQVMLSFVDVDHEKYTSYYEDWQYGADWCFGPHKSNCGDYKGTASSLEDCADQYLESIITDANKCSHDELKKRQQDLW